jgi:hypothetical protein
MAVLTWMHGRSKEDAVVAIKAALTAAGYDGWVTWIGAAAEAGYGPFASIVHVVGEVTDEAVVIEVCSGLAGRVVFGRLREMLAQLFPASEPVSAPPRSPEQSGPPSEGVTPSEEAPSARQVTPALVVQPKITSPATPVGCWIAAVTCGLLLVASLVAWYLQSPPVSVARQYLSEQLAVAPDDLELVGHRGNFWTALVRADMTVELRVKGAKQPKRVVNLARPVYFLPWCVSGLREEPEK